MRKHFLAAACLMMSLLLAVPALAEPLVSNGSYTAYLADNNHLYLTEHATNVTKVLANPIATLIGMDDSKLYCQTGDGRLYSITLDGTGNTMISTAPTAAELATYAGTSPYRLEGNVLSLVNADGTATQVSTQALVADATTEALYFVEKGVIDTANVLKVLPLNQVGVATPLASTLRADIAAPLSMIVSANAITIVSQDHRVHVIDPTNGNMESLVAASQNTTLAFCFNGKLVRLTVDNTTGYYQVENVMNYSVGLPAATATPTVAPTKAPVPTATMRPTATSKPSATKKPSSSSSSSSSSSDSEYGSLSKGAKGSKVRKMQERLAALGYPVGTVDGVFGDNTLLAVNLFQCAIGYTNRTYASSSMLEKLYSRKAPEYDPYAPLRDGDKGADVRLMQQMLYDLGYDVGKKGVDGAFGKDTKEAVKQFQFLAGLEVTGDADAETLKKLFDKEHPIPYGTVTPTPAPTPTIVPPTEAPTVAPTETPTVVPPTEAPTIAPTEAPTPTPTPDPTPTPTPEDIATMTDLK